MKTHYHSRAASAEYLKKRGLPITKATLQKYATVGGGPIYQIFGNRALYTEENLDAWADEKLSAPRRSTSDIEAAGQGGPRRDEPPSPRERRTRAGDGDGSERKGALRRSTSDTEAVA